MFGYVAPIRIAMLKIAGLLARRPHLPMSVCSHQA